MFARFYASAYNFLCSGERLHNRKLLVSAKLIVLWCNDFCEMPKRSKLSSSNLHRDVRQSILKILIQEHRRINLSIGLLGNVCFFVGSVLFLPQLDPHQTIGVWLFIFGSLFMLIGSIGQLLTDFWKES